MRAVTMLPAARLCAAREKLREALQSGAWRTDSVDRDALVQLAAAAGDNPAVQAVIENAPSAARCLLEGEASVLVAWRYGRLGARGGAMCNRRADECASMTCGCAVVQDRLQQRQQQRSDETTNELVRSVRAFMAVVNASNTDIGTVAAAVRACPDVASAIVAASTAADMVDAAREHGEDAGAGHASCGMGGLARAV